MEGFHQGTPLVQERLREWLRQTGPADLCRREAPPAGHWSTLPLLGAMSREGMLASMTVDAPTDGVVFLAYLDQVLCPALRPGQVGGPLRSAKARTVDALEEIIPQALQRSPDKTPRRGFPTADTVYTNC